MYYLPTIQGIISEQEKCLINIGEYIVENEMNKSMNRLRGDYLINVHLKHLKNIKKVYLELAGIRIELEINDSVVYLPDLAPIMSIFGPVDLIVEPIGEGYFSYIFARNEVYIDCPDYNKDVIVVFKNYRFIYRRDFVLVENKPYLCCPQYDIRESVKNPLHKRKTNKDNILHVAYLCEKYEKNIYFDMNIVKIIKDFYGSDHFDCYFFTHGYDAWKF